MYLNIVNSFPFFSPSPPCREGREMLQSVDAKKQLSGTLVNSQYWLYGMTNIGYMEWPKLAIAYIKYFFMRTAFFVLFAVAASIKGE